MPVNKIAPIFHYQLTNPTRNDYGVITADGLFLHRIKNVRNFYAVLGYTPEMSKSGVEAEVFIWTEYSKDEPKKSCICLQQKIIDFLIENSTEFIEKYGSDYLNWSGTCDKSPTAAASCTGCRMLPIDDTADSYS